MDEQQDRPFVAAQVPMQSGGGVSPAMGVAAPVGAVSRKDRARAGRTALTRPGPTDLLLRTSLPGSVVVQRRAGRAWETLDTRRASRLGRTHLTLPDDGSSAVYRVVFSPKNPNIASWISEDLRV